MSSVGNLSHPIVLVDVAGVVMPFRCLCDQAQVLLSLKLRTSLAASFPDLPDGEV